MVPAGLSHKRLFKDNIRHYETLSKAKTPSVDKKDVDVTPNDEAFILMWYENYRARWMKLWDIKRKNPGKKINVRKGKAAESTGNLANPRTNVTVFKDDIPDLKTKYTRNDRGQNLYGGIEDEGIRNYIEYKGLNKAARKTDNAQKLEQALLDSLRKDKDIKEKTHELQVQLHGATGAASVPPAAAKPAYAGMYDECLEIFGDLEEPLAEKSKKRSSKTGRRKRDDANEILSLSGPSGGSGDSSEGETGLDEDEIGQQGTC